MFPCHEAKDKKDLADLEAAAAAEKKAGAYVGRVRWACGKAQKGPYKMQGFNMYVYKKHRIGIGAVKTI